MNVCYRVWSDLYQCKRNDNNIHHKSIGLANLSAENDTKPYIFLTNVHISLYVCKNT